MFSSFHEAVTEFDCISAYLQW